MRDLLDGPQGWVRHDVRGLLRQPLFTPRHGLSTEEHRAWVLEQLVELGRHPSTVSGFPEEHGGRGDVAAFVSGFETLAYGDLSMLVKVGVHFGLYGGAIQQLGTARHHAEHLPGVIDVSTPGCFAMTETGHGSDVQALRTTASYDDEAHEFVINTPDRDAWKDYIGNAARDGRSAVVFAQLDTLDGNHGVHAFVVPIRDERGEVLPGITIEDCGHKGGLNGVDNGRICFDQVRVPREALLDRFGQVSEDGHYSSPIESEGRRFFTMLGTLVQGRVSISGAATSSAEVALTIAVRHALQRRQFAPPGEDREEVLLLDYLAHQRRLLPKLATTYGLHLAQRELVSMLHRVRTDPDVTERDRRRLETRAAGLKAISTWHASETIQTCREACGGFGYLSENRLVGLKADTDVFATFEGDNTVLLQLVTKSLLTDYREEFGELDTLGTVRFVLDQVVTNVVEWVSGKQLIQSLIDAVPGREDDTDLRDRGWHLALFAHREEHVLDGLAQRIRAGIGQGRDAFEVFNLTQDHVLLAARAHLDRVVLEGFVAEIEAAHNPRVKAMLETLCDLHALSTIERERAWFLEHGEITSSRAKGVIHAVNELCTEVRPHAAALVDAFGIPEETIAAPIASSTTAP